MIKAIFMDIIRFATAYVKSAGVFALGIVSLILVAIIVAKRYFVLSSAIEETFSVQNGIKILMRIFILAMYLYIVLGITILSRSESSTREVSFQLFRTFRNTFAARKQIYENIIMFVPYAILLHGLSKWFWSLGRMLLIGTGSSLLIEVTQWVTCRGYFEVDDILTNTIGMLLGYLVCLLIEKMKLCSRSEHLLRRP